MSVIREWNGSAFQEGVIRGMNHQQCCECIAKLQWCEDNPVKSTHISDTLEHQDAWRIRRERFNR